MSSDRQIEFEKTQFTTSIIQYHSIDHVMFEFAINILILLKPEVIIASCMDR
jgi:hypothetical protein